MYCNPGVIRNCSNSPQSHIRLPTLQLTFFQHLKVFFKIIGLFRQNVSFSSRQAWGWRDRYGTSGWISIPRVDTSCSRNFSNETCRVRETEHKVVYWLDHSHGAGADERSVRLLCACVLKPTKLQSILPVGYFAFLMKVKAEFLYCSGSTFMQKYVGIGDSYWLPKNNEVVLDELERLRIPDKTEFRGEALLK